VYQTVNINKPLLKNEMVKIIRGYRMKNLALLALASIIISCSTTRRYSSNLKEDELINSRKYIGNFIDYCHTDPGTFCGTHLIWIKTTLFNTYGKISAYGSNCNFSPGDKVYLRRLYATPEKQGNWVYQIENDSSVYYRVSDFRYENNVLVQASF
jgi:hypothetical protein